MWGWSIAAAHSGVAVKKLVQLTDKGLKTDYVLVVVVVVVSSMGNGEKGGEEHNKEVTEGSGGTQEEEVGMEGRETRTHWCIQLIS